MVPRSALVEPLGDAGGETPSGTFVHLESAGRRSLAVGPAGQFLQRERVHIELGDLIAAAHQSEELALGRGQCRIRHHVQNTDVQLADGLVQRPARLEDGLALLSQALDVRALAADDDARPRGEYRHAGPVGVPLDQDLGFPQRVEDLPIEKLVSQLFVEGFHVTVLPGTTRCDIERLYLDPGQPAPHRRRRQESARRGGRRAPRHREHRHA